MFGPSKNDNEVALNESQINDVMRMMREMPIFNLAFEAYLSMTLCSPFTFHIRNIDYTNEPDMLPIVERYWMPWLRKVYKVWLAIGVVPFYFKNVGVGDNKHPIPVVPDMDMGYITVRVTKDNDKDFKWYWTHGTVPKEHPMLWIHEGSAPDSHGILWSKFASLLPAYRQLLVLYKNRSIASTRGANPIHVFEHHPKPSDTGNSGLLHLRAEFGAKAAGEVRSRQIKDKNAEIRVKANHFYNQLKQTYDMNRGMTREKKRKLAWTDDPEDVLERNDMGMYGNSVALTADYKYVSASKPTLIGDIAKAESDFNLTAAALIGFPLELIRPTGSARTQNIQGSERYLNEMVKSSLNFFKSNAQAALVVAYRKKFQKKIDDAKTIRLNQRGGDAFKVAQTYVELDVEVNMTCTPMTTLTDIRSLWQDGVMSKLTYATHAFQMKGLPLEQIEMFEYVDGQVKEKEKETAVLVPPKKKKKKKKAEKVDE